MHYAYDWRYLLDIDSSFIFASYASCIRIPGCFSLVLSACGPL